MNALKLKFSLQSLLVWWLGGWLFNAVNNYCQSTLAADDDYGSVDSSIGTTSIIPTHVDVDGIYIVIYVYCICVILNIP